MFINDKKWLNKLIVLGKYNASALLGIYKYKQDSHNSYL